MRIAFFDFDGTISTKDSLLHFTAYAKGDLTFYIGIIFLSPVLVLHKMGVISSQRTKNIFLNWYFRNMDAVDFSNVAKEYARGQLNSIVKPSMLESIRIHLANGDRVVVVSASPENYLQPWCSNLNIECIATKLATANGKLTGKIDGANCNGSEKARRIREVIDLSLYSEMYGYGNGSGDKEMLALCNHVTYV